jgi:DNA polymerase
MPSTLNVDIETYSSGDLKKCGMYRYAQSPDFEILMIAFSIDGGEVQILDVASEELNYDDRSGPAYQFLKSLRDPEVKKIAYNAQFERVCFEAFYGEPMPPDHWECTMIKAAMLGLPMGLGNVASILKLDQQKDFSGSALIRYFCLPCKPTATNSGRTRNLPHEAPEKWEAFKNYCMDDVRTEMAVGQKIAFFSIPEKEVALWNLDQKINGYGILVDKKFVRMAVDMDQSFRERLTTEALELTGLDNPNSVKQLTAWLSVETGDEIETLRKADVPVMLKKYDGDKITRVLEIRQEMAKTSVKKYISMANTVCLDGRIRGLFQFAGARTLRWAGRLVQMQNLPQNHISDLELARSVVREGDVDTLEMCYGNVPDTLSQLIRTAFVAGKGNTFGVLDFSAIEARVIAWVAKENWRLEVFKTHGKIYEASAAAMFGVPLESVTKGSDLRSKGKVAELACIAKGSLVLTERGLIPIELVLLDDKVFDGIGFCRHKGVIFRGKKKVITYEGLTATTDHLVWVEGESKPIQFGIAAASGQNLTRPIDGWRSLWPCKNNIPRKKMDERLALSYGSDQMPKLSIHSVDELQQSKTTSFKRLPKLLSTAEDTEMARSEADSCKTALHKSIGQRVQKLRSKGYKFSVPFGIGSGSLFTKEISKFTKAFRVRSNRQQRELCPRKYSFCGPQDKQFKQTHDSFEKLGFNPMALFLHSNPEIFEPRNDEGTDISQSPANGYRETQELAFNIGEVEVFDITYCGPNNRFVVEGALVHNCGYGGGPNALVNMGALKMGLLESDLQGLINAWRESNPAIVRFWKDCEKAVVSAIEGVPVSMPEIGLRFFCKKGLLFIELPSKRCISYYKPGLKPGKFGGQSACYWGNDSITKQWKEIDTYGGKIVENIVQAIARDCLAEVMLSMDKAGFKIVAHVHDEVIVELSEETAANDFFILKDIMSSGMPWALGLPLTADGYLTPFYKKD